MLNLNLGSSIVLTARRPLLPLLLLQRPYHCRRAKLPTIPIIALRHLLPQRQTSRERGMGEHLSIFVLELRIKGPSCLVRGVIAQFRVDVPPD